MNYETNAAVLCAVLFAGGEPQIIDRLCEILHIDYNELIKTAEYLNENLNKIGLRVVKLDNSYQICTMEEYSEYIKTMFDIKRKTPLSPAAFEVLAVIAYNQPITKSYVEQVRGVDCTGVISTLIEKELIEERGRLDLPGRPLLYGTTPNFLRCFSLNSLDDLPPLPKDQDDQAEQLVMDDAIPKPVIDEIE
ncbi:MAG: SMC-Scp complex subunit ScpB [Oscillospiraceae bacterium]|nr:SMC-Scp complex subunit ScpB [Candidatus Equicaccousia limihippi]